MNLVDVAGAHGQKDVARPKPILQNRHKLVKRGGEFRGNSVSLQPANQFFGHGRRFGVHGLPRGEHGRDPHLIGRGETVREVIHERRRARDLVRLERHAQPPTAEFFSYGVEGRSHGGRMMGVIVHQCHTAPRADFFKPPVDAGELGDAVADCGRGDADLIAECGGRERVQNVMLADQR